VSVAVPAQYQGIVNTAAQTTGLPVDVVAAQIQTESSWNPGAESPTGAQGIAQFEPGTWAMYGSGSPLDPTAAMAAYAKFMSVLLRQFNGNVRNALAAYNAGAGNLAAGYGYADKILAMAGTGTNVLGVPATGGTVSGVPISSGSASATTVATGHGSTCAFALGTKNKILIWTVDFSICIISKTEVRALLGALLLAGGAVVTMAGVALVMQYALDKSGTMDAVAGRLPLIAGVLK
jgi:Transglycosylase SLT domain